MSSVFEQLRSENAAHDPHGFKSQGANSRTSVFPDPQVEFAAFPATVYRDVKAKDEEITESKIVQDEESLKAAVDAGWRTTPKAE